MKPCVKCFLLLSALVLVLPVTAQQGGTIVIENSDSNSVTRVGCYEEFVCTGVGTRISWRVFGNKQDLRNDTEKMYYVITDSEPFPNDNTDTVFTWTSRLIFPSVILQNGNSYSCIIFYDVLGQDVAPVLASVQLHVSPDAIAIEPEIGNRNISSYSVGDTLLVGCPVKTCATGITVQFLFNDSLVATGMPSSTDERVYTMNLPITTDSPGTYFCKVVTENPPTMVVQAFNITGTPIVPPTLAPGETPPVTTPAVGATTDSSSLSLTPSIWLLLFALLFSVFKSY